MQVGSRELLSTKARSAGKQRTPASSATIPDCYAVQAYLNRLNRFFPNLP